jgi:hypothetical protein
VQGPEGAGGDECQGVCERVGMTLDFLSGIPKESWPAITAIIAFFGAFIGAGVAFLGVWLNNKSEDKRRKDQRRHDLICETYFGAVEYIAYFVRVIASAGGDQFLELIQSKEANSKNYYFLNLVASSDVMASFVKLGDKATEIIAKVSLKHIEIVTIDSEIKSESKMWQIYEDQMDKLLGDHKELISQKGFSKNIADNILDCHGEILEKFNSSIERHSQLNQSLFQKKIDLMKFIKVSMRETNPMINEVVFLMRKDLDRKLSNKDLQNMKIVLERSLSNSVNSIDNMILELENFAQKEFSKA